MSSSRKQTGPKEGAIGTSDLQLIGQKHRWPPGVADVGEGGAVLAAR